MTFDYTFDEATGHVTIAEGSTKIPGDSFLDRSEVKSVSIPHSVTKIGSCSFCFNELTELVIPGSVASIGNNAFSYNLLTQVVIPDSVASINNYTFDSNFLAEVAIPDSVTKIGGWAFFGNELTELVIPDSVTSIGKAAFNGNKLTEVVIPDSVTSIGRWAFTENNLADVILPAHFKDSPPYSGFDIDVDFTFRDALEPTPETETYDGIVESVRGKGKLNGTNFADAFTFDSFDFFTKKAADKIIGFDASQGDTIAVSQYAFPALQAASELNFASTKNKMELKLLSKQDYDFVYFKKKGRLYFDGNGSDKYWGNTNEGGLVAILKGKPELTGDDFTLLG